MQENKQYNGLVLKCNKACTAYTFNRWAQLQGRKNAKNKC